MKKGLDISVLKKGRIKGVRDVMPMRELFLVQRWRSTPSSSSWMQ